MIGQRFNRLTVESFAYRKNGQTYWNCICDCGTIKALQIGHLRAGHTKSCGCLRRELASLHPIKHGLSQLPISKHYYALTYRCNTHQHYIKRNITVCYRWLGDGGLKNFIEDMSTSFIEGLELDRTDNNKGYSPENCRWVTRSQNGKNRSTKAEKQSNKDHVTYNKQANRWKYSKEFTTQEEAEKLAKFIELYHNKIELW